MLRYADHGKPIPREWIEELLECALGRASDGATMPFGDIVGYESAEIVSSAELRAINPGRVVFRDDVSGGCVAPDGKPFSEHLRADNPVRISWKQGRVVPDEQTGYPNAVLEEIGRRADALIDRSRPCGTDGVRERLIAVRDAAFGRGKLGS